MALWREVGGAGGRPPRIAATEKLEPAADRVTTDLRAALGVGVEVTIYRGHEEHLTVRRRLAEGRTLREWGVLRWEHALQAADAVVLELHRAFVDATGE